MSTSTRCAPRSPTGLSARGTRRCASAPARQRHRAATRIVARDPQRARVLLVKAGIASPPRHAEEGLWMAPLMRCRVGEPLANKRLTAEEYLTLADQTGRVIRAGKRGSIPPELAAILTRFDLEVGDWLVTMLGWRQMLGSALGHTTSRMAEASRRGMRWVQNRCPLFRAREQVAA